MAANELERAVIDAARVMYHEGSPDDWASCGVVVAMGKLIEHEAAHDPTVKEVGWHEVCEGDELRSANNGRFYPVLGAVKMKDGHRITIQLPNGPKTITRPTEKEPTATVRRGPTGDAMDMLTTVFSSGGK